MNPRPPVIIIGMHRSGTSLVCRLLEQAGLFVGRELDPNHEAIFFVQLNQWLMSASGGSWVHPTAMHEFLADDALRDIAADYCGRMVRGPRTRGFLGLSSYLRQRSLHRLDVPWGWKDPRNTFTLPIWLSVFPEARIVHVKRHGVDVAQSLVTRWQKDIGRAQEFMAGTTPTSRRFTKRGFRGPKGIGPSSAPRCRSLDTAFDLWEEYIAEASAHVKTMGDRAMEFRYEDLLAGDGGDLWPDLLAFCGLHTDNASLSQLPEGVKRDRASAYLSNDALAEFSESVATRLAAFGY